MKQNETEATKAGNGNQSSKSRAGQRSDNRSMAESEGEDSVLGQVQESGREIAGRSLEALGARTRSATSAYQSDISAGLHTLADGLRQTSSTFQDAADDKPLSSAGARYIDDLAGRIDSISDYFEKADVTAVMKDVKGFARRNPAIFVGGAFAAGFALSRLVRSASPSQQRSER